MNVVSENVPEKVVALAAAILAAVSFGSFEQIGRSTDFLHSLRMCHIEPTEPTVSSQLSCIHFKP